ncbi:MAG: MoxR family ATPase [Acidobacteria bacterium]|nr:MoxR family ATPase [Acidobacteriota bacterium]
MTDNNTVWPIFTGNLEPSERLNHLPPAPPWRPFAKGERPSGPKPLGGSDDHQAKLEAELGKTFLAAPDLVDAVNAALFLRRPLLLTGRPGVGKSSLIRAVARELQLGVVLDWSITSRSTLKEGIYDYDALGRLYAKNAGEESSIGNFVTLGPLGIAMMESTWPRALLIDEIDKSDLDLPNDLLNIFEKGEYTIPELNRAGVGPVEVRCRQGPPTMTITGGRIRCTQFPFVVLTSNGEREFPGPFLRRCVRLEVKEPSLAQLEQIVTRHFNEEQKARAMDLIQEFHDRRLKGQLLASDQLLNAVFLLSQGAKGMTDRILEPLG